jgi:hypothetical protein
LPGFALDTLISLFAGLAWFVRNATTAQAQGKEQAVSTRRQAISTNDV